MFAAYYSDGSIIIESNVDTWDKINKKEIVKLELTHNNKKTFLTNPDLRGRFFQHKTVVHNIGGTPHQINQQIGLVTSRNGDCIIHSMDQNGDLQIINTNVKTIGLNLPLHGIDLNEID